MLGGKNLVGFDFNKGLTSLGSLSPSSPFPDSVTIGGTFVTLPNCVRNTWCYT